MACKIIMKTYNASNLTFKVLSVYVKMTRDPAKVHDRDY